MALTFTTGMTLINAADAVTNWAAFRLAGSGGSPTAVIRNDTFREGTGCVSAKCTGNSWDSGLIFDRYTASGNTTLNMTTAGNEVIAIWTKCDVSSKILNFNAEGYYIIVSSSADTGATSPTVYSKWTIAGADTYAGGWVLMMIDTRKTPTTTVGGGANLAAVRRIGVGNKNVASVGTILTDTFYVDALWYGRPQYKVVGDGSTSATWADFLSHSVTNNNGLIESAGGTYVFSAGVRIGDAAQSATTTFADATGRAVSFARKTYYSGGTADALNYADYYALDAQGAASFKTSITFGSVVGSGDARQGVLGGSIKAEDSNVTWSIDFKTDKSDLTNVKLYGMSLTGATGGILLNNDSGGTNTEVISTQFVNCGEIDPGTTGNGAVILNSFIVDPKGLVNNYGLLFPQTPSGTLTHNIKNVNFITSGSPATQYMTRFTANADYSLTFDGIKFFGSFTSGTLWHGLNSGTNADITINTSNGADPVGSEFSNTASGTTTVVSGARLVKAVAVDSAGAAITGTNVFLRAAAGGNLPSDASITSIARSGTTATATFAAAHNLVNNDLLLVAGITDKTEDNKVHTVTVTGTTTVTFTTTDSGSTSYTGTKTGTFVFLKGNASGGSGGNEVSVSRSIPATQPVTGWIRKSTLAGGTRYKQGALAGSISTSQDTTLTGVLIEDE
jgi:hypothetical protein